MIPFNKISICGNEKKYVLEVLDSGLLTGDGSFTQKCGEMMRKLTKAQHILLTTSCTGAMELASLALNIKKGDEIITPSFAFPSSANSFVLRGAKPAFVDVRTDTLNLDEDLIEDKITDNTAAILPIHYAGVSCNMDVIMKIANKHGLRVIEDAAQAVNASYKGVSLGTLGDFGAFSFHGSKNIVCGEGGALVVKDKILFERAEIIREKGTDRARFIRGETDKYTWRDVGSSYLPSELQAAVLLAQLEQANDILDKRKALYNQYHTELGSLEDEGLVNLPVIPKECESNYHSFHLIVKDESTRNRLIAYLKNAGISASFHYLPLHTSVMGRKLGWKAGDLPNTESLSSRLVRLPLFNDLSQNNQAQVINFVKKFFKRQ